MIGADVPLCRPQAGHVVVDELPVDLTSVGRARHQVRAGLTRHGVPDPVADLAELLTSELVTNAVRYAASRRQIDLRVSVAETLVRVDVSDGVRARPVVRRVAPATSRGRGMLLVQELSSSWGIDRTVSGKTVWFELEASPRRVDPGEEVPRVVRHVG